MTSKEQIIKAAIKLYGNKRNVTLKDIAEAADVSNSLLNFHFGSRDELYKAALEHARKSKNRECKQFIRAHDFFNKGGVIYGW
jgi:AcrR family transcriptional regulator